jgi:hypothetical protein
MFHRHIHRFKEVPMRTLHFAGATLLASLAFSTAAVAQGPNEAISEDALNSNMSAQTHPVPRTVPEVIHTTANPRGSSAPPVQYPDPKTASDPLPPTLPSDPEYQGEPYKGALAPPPPSAFGKDYPLCTAEVQDGCRNAGGV